MEVNSFQILLDDFIFNIYAAPAVKGLMGKKYSNVPWSQLRRSYIYCYLKREDCIGDRWARCI